MSHHNYISRNIFVSVLAIAFILASPLNLSAQEDSPGLCCDPDGTGDIEFNCFPGGFFIHPDNGCVEDPDCTNYNPSAGCLTIPIEDGIPFLIIAGGVLAFYKLREKKERVVTEA